MHPAIRKILFAAMATVFLLSACGIPAQPTQSASDVTNQIATSVAATVAAQNAQTQAVQSPTPQVTNTTLPTQTQEGLPSPTAIIPTVTPVLAPTTRPSSGGSSSGGGNVVSTGYACDAISRRPFDNTVFKPDKPFDIKWTIVNSGTKTMRAGLDVKFSRGTLMANTNIVELPELKPGAQYVVNFDAVSPHKEGTYVMTFMVEGGLCFPYTVIVVEK